jgi:menaquinone-9 beta-reductase
MLSNAPLSSAIQSTLSLSDAAAGVWDVVVVGAGPSGAVTALCAAQCGLRVLLVDRQVPPRYKPCGCCLNGAALEILSNLGLSGALNRLNPISLSEFQCRNKSESVKIPLNGVTVPRECFDAMLVENAIERGAMFLAPAIVTQTNLQAASRTVTLREGTQISAKLVVAASGLGGSWLRSESNLRDEVATGSALGLSATFDSNDPFPATGTLYMILGDNGYAGVVRQSSTRVHVAAYVRSVSGAHETVQALFRDANVPLTIPGSAHWQGTSKLTHRREEVAGERLLLVGDVASYSEPFTGEGIAWAMASGAMTTPFALQTRDRWSDDLSLAWRRAYNASIQRRQYGSRLLSAMLRHRSSRAVLFSTLSHFPAVARSFMKQMVRPYAMETSQ